MKRWFIGIIVGLLIGSTAHGDMVRQPLEEVDVKPMTANQQFVLPTSYGRLVNVAMRSEVQYLYFEGADGTIRIMLLGPKGSTQRAKSDLQLLTPEVFVVRRGEPR